MFHRVFLGTAIIVFAILSGVLFKFFTLDVRPDVVSKFDYVNQKRQIKCLADNIYYEAGNQSLEGMKAVAFVTINRMNSNVWPADACEVVYQKTGSTCQFSWVCEHTKAPNNVMWDKAYNIARHVWYKYDTLKDPTHGAMYYHAVYVKPGWKLSKTVQIDDHIFYK